MFSLEGNKGDVVTIALENRRERQAKGQVITIAKIKRVEPKVYVISQPGIIPDRPEWMEGEPGFIQRVHRSCPVCRSNDVWRGPWCHFSEAYYVLVRLEPPVKHSGRKRNASCRDCGDFWNDIQAVQYKYMDWESED